MNIIIIAPHPDTEVLGCGGTIAKYSQRGDHITVCYATKGYPPDWSEDYLVKKEREIGESNSVLGISERIDLGYPTVQLDTIPQKNIADSLIKIINEVRPDIAFIPNRSDLNKDHQIMHDAALVALRPLTHRCLKVLAYETLSETEWGPYPQTFHPDYYIDISETLEKKIGAMKVFATELKKAPHPRSTEIIRALAMKRGSEILAMAAEAFMVIRIIEERNN